MVFCLLNNGLKLIIDVADQSILLQPKTVEDTEKHAMEPIKIKGKKRKRKEDTQTDSKSKDDILDYIAKLEDENKKLKTKMKTEMGQGSKQKRKKARNVEDWTEKQSEGDSSPKVDVSAWKEFFLDDEILIQLSKVGFTAPTQIQAECLPAAIRDRRDIIGAAQTVSWDVFYHYIN
jgi:ATP-dependent RNA helicase DDX24/MAK5